LPNAPTRQFTFDRCLGRGGFGEVYLAHQRMEDTTTRRVAVKLIRADLKGNEREAMRQLRSEAHVLSLISHPSIPKVHDLLWIDGSLALISNYIPGIDLGAFCKLQRRMPERALLEIIGHIATALDAAWKTPSPETGDPLQLVHRDIKPDNIRVSLDGSVSLLDFGLVQTAELAGEAGHDAGEHTYTRGYLAPETLTTGQRGPEADIYALGVTAFRLLSGRRLYAKTSLPERYQTARDARRYAAFVTKRLDEIGYTAVRILIESMLRHQANRRPTAESIAASAAAIGSESDTLDLRAWAAQMGPDDPQSFESHLTGHTLIAEDPIRRSKGSSPRHRSSGPATLPPHVLADLSPELQAVAEATAEVHFTAEVPRLPKPSTPKGCANAAIFLLLCAGSLALLGGHGMSEDFEMRGGTNGAIPAMSSTSTWNVP